ncbi:hypothetical protein PM082_012520 [Marasmius tenuissimus]|nr:hypothetical protein PM082_012520 [Marasmius tenuissimus]
MLIQHYRKSPAKQEKFPTKKIFGPSKITQPAASSAISNTNAPVSNHPDPTPVLETNVSSIPSPLALPSPSSTSPLNGPIEPSGKDAPSPADTIPALTRP